jgi:phosphomannomutase
MTKITCFKAYDVRGRVPEDLNEDVAYRIGRAYADFLSPSKIVIGRDIRLTSPALSLALQRGLTESGVDVIDIGIGGTELVYFATAHLELDGGVMVTASHNPPNYNGMKFVREKARPISEDTGLAEIRALAEKNDIAPAERSGNVETLDIMADYIDHLLGYVDRSALAPLKVVVNAGNGGAGPIIDRLEPHLPFEFIKVNHEPDGTFPNGVPNPMLEQNRASTAEPIVRLGADLGLAWDGDFDRCFFFDETGRFIEGYYIVGLLAQAFLEKSADERIVHDPRLTWNTLDIVGQMGGTTIQSKSGHAFIKETMRVSNAVYGGEMSAHHYFRDFSYADSGMIPWLLVAQIMSARACPLSQLVDERMANFPASGEINRKVADAAVALNTLENRYRDSAISIEHVDGLSMEFEDWRFNLRASNTEPLVRLNVESRGKPDLMAAKTEELLALVGGDPG